MDKKPFEHFNFNPEFPDFPGPSSIAGISKESLKEFEKSEAYKKYVFPVLEREKQQKKQKRTEWLWSKGILILNTVLAGIAAVSSLLALLKQ